MSAAFSSEFFYGVSIATIAVLGVFFVNFQRSRKQKNWELRPNCLMTRYPLVFLTGRRSLFYFLSYWNDIPDYLAQHGYQVQVLNLNWNNTRIRSQQIEKYLLYQSRSREKIHLFVDNSSLNEMIFLLQRQDFECLESITLLGSETLIPPYRLRVPIHTLEIKNSALGKLGSQKLAWKIHSLMTSQTGRQFRSSGLTQLGWQLDTQNGYSLLERVQTLAESDLLKNRSFFTLEK